MELSHAVWRRSSFSTDGADCIEIAYPVEGTVASIRDSKNLAGGMLPIRLPAWEAFRHLVRR